MKKYGGWMSERKSSASNLTIKSKVNAVDETISIHLINRGYKSSRSNEVLEKQTENTLDNDYCMTDRPRNLLQSL